MNVVGSSKIERKGILKSLSEKLPGGVGFPLSLYESVLLECYSWPAYG